MAERLKNMFSSPKFKENRTYLNKHLLKSVSPLLSSSRYNSTQDELALELDAKSEGFTSRICDTANSLLLGEFPWGGDKQGDNLIIKQKRLPKPVPVRLHIGPPNSSALLVSDTDNSEYENEDYNSSKSLIQALREMSRKRSHSIMNEECDTDMESSAAAAKRTCKQNEFRHNLYLSQLEEETQEYKNNINNTTDQLLERTKRGREEDNSNALGMDSLLVNQDLSISKRQRRSGIPTQQEIINGIRSPDERNSLISNGIISEKAIFINDALTRIRRGSNEIISSLSSSLAMLDPSVSSRLIRPILPREKHKKRKKVVTTETQTIDPIVEEETVQNKSPLKGSTSPKTEDKCMNTDPEKPVKQAIVLEKLVTDKMANALMKRAVSKFIATEDPTLSPVRPPLPTTNVESTVSVSNIVSDCIVPNVMAPSGNNVLKGTTPLSLSSNEKQTILGNNTFTFGSTSLDSNMTPNLLPSTKSTTDISPFTFGSSTTVNNGDNNISITSKSVGVESISTQQIPNDIATAKPAAESVKEISFGDNKLMANFKMPGSKDETDQKATVTSELFKQPAVTVTGTIEPAVVSATSTTSSELGKVTFSFSFPTASTTETTSTNVQPIKAPTFSFGSTNTNSTAKFSVTPSSAEQTTKTNVEPQKLSLFGTQTAASTIKPSNSGTISNAGITSAFQFGTGNNNNDKKTDKAEEKKPQGLFDFGTATAAAVSTATETTAKTESKPFAFNTSVATTTSGTTSQNASKPVFQFGTSLFSTPQPNKDFGFGSKPASEQLAAPPTFGSTGGGLFSAQPAPPSTSTSATTTATTTSGLFGFGNVQSTATTTAAPSFGSVTSSTNNSVGGFNFQPDKSKEKPSASGGFAFKFTGGASSSNTSTEATKPAFTFGQPSTPAFGASTAQTAAPSFGATTVPTTNPAFGVTTVPTTNPAFGATTVPTTNPAFGATTVPTTNPAFGATTVPTTNSAFGATTVQSSVAPFGTTTSLTTVPAFGSNSAQTTAPAFGANSVQTTAPAFGVTTVQTTASAFGATTQATPVFGTSSMAAQPTFGSVTPAAPSFSSFSTPTGTSTFGASSATPNPTPAFGSTTATPTFGTPSAVATPQPTLPVFGSMQPQQQPQQQQPQAPSFTFGTSNPSGGFNFGATAQTPAQSTSSTGMFQFGSSTTPQNTTGGVQPFQFSAGPPSTPQGFGFSTNLGGFNPSVGGGQPMFSIGSGSTAPRTRQLRRKK